MAAPDYSIPGFRIHPVDSGPGSGGFQVHCQAEQPGWRAYPGFSHARPTAIRYRGAYHRIAQSEADPAGGWRYLLLPWPETERAWEVVELSAEAHAAAQASARDEARTARRARLAWLFVPWAGFLPARLQRRLADSWHFPTETATFLGGLLTLLLGLGTGLLGIAMRRAELTALGALMMLDGVVRLSAPLAGHDALGPIPFEIFDWILRGAPTDFRADGD